MNWNNIEQNWSNFKTTVQQKWADLTDEDLDKLDGNRDQLVGTVQERYSLNDADAQREVDDWQNSQSVVGSDFDASTGLGSTAGLGSATELASTVDLESSADFEADDDLKSGAYLEPSGLDSDTNLDSFARLDSGDIAVTNDLDSSEEFDANDALDDSDNADFSADPNAEAKYNPDYTGSDSKELIDDEGQPIDEGYGRGENPQHEDKKPGSFNPPSDKEHQEKSVDQT